jgi:serine/threonine-protein kinase HipA
MRLLDVYYSGWGEDWRLAQLADDGRQLLFEYSSEALAQGLELSPVHLKLRAPAYGNFPPQQFHLPGLIADALPDGWGLLLMARLFRQQKLPHPSPLDRLAFIGERALGALRFVPATPTEVSAPDWNLLTLAQHSMQMLKGEARSVLRELAVTGGSPQGARPKALVHYEPRSGKLSTHSEAPGAPWLVKFPAQGEHPEVCAIESLYLNLAAACGIETPNCQLFELTPKISAIALARFDREADLRVPIHSLAGLLHCDFRQPGSVDYLGLLRATRLLTRDEREVQKAFARAVFNALLHNRDDHPKNIAFRLGQDRRWRLAPAFDLTFSSGPGGQHHMDFGGVGHEISGEHLHQLAKAGGLSAAFAQTVIERTADVANEFAARARALPIRAATVRRLAASVAACVRLALAA